LSRSKNWLQLRGSQLDANVVAPQQINRAKFEKEGPMSLGLSPRIEEEVVVRMKDAGHFLFPAETLSIANACYQQKS
jgi:hypothetical protein